MFQLIFCCFLILITLSSYSIAFVNYQTKFLKPNQVYSQNDSSVLIFCKKQNPKVLSKVWAQSYIKFENISTSYFLLDGSNPAQAYEKFLTHSKQWQIFSVNIHNYRSMRYLPYFDQYCFTIVSKTPFQFVYYVNEFNIINFLIMMHAIVVFYNSHHLCRSIFLYYTCSVTFGVIFSLFILFFLISRLTPKKLKSLSFVFGWSSFLFTLKLFWDKLKAVSIFFQNYLVYYILFASLLSFAFAYQRGPITDSRTLKLIQWTFQILSLIVLVLSTQMISFSITLIMIMLTHYNFGEAMSRFILHFFRRRFQPKIKFLSEEEYNNQAAIYTKSELLKLREYCRSNFEHTWLLVGKLKEPKKFADFVEGKEHIGFGPQQTDDNKHFNNFTIDDFINDSNDDIFQDEFFGAVNESNKQDTKREHTEH